MMCPGCQQTIVDAGCGEGNGPCQAAAYALGLARDGRAPTWEGHGAPPDGTAVVTIVKAFGVTALIVTQTALVGAQAPLIGRCRAMLISVTWEGEFDSERQLWLCVHCAESPHADGCKYAALLRDIEEITR